MLNSLDYMYEPLFLYILRWPLIIDPNGQAATFLRYRDTNYLCALSPTQMEPEKVRMSVLGSIRYVIYRILHGLSLNTNC